MAGKRDVYAARHSGPDACPRSKPRVSRIRQTPKHRHNSCTNLGIEILQQLFLLLDEIVRDARVESLPLRRRVQGRRSPVVQVRTLFDVFFLTSVLTTRLVVLLSRNKRSASPLRRTGPCCTSVSSA